MNKTTSKFKLIVVLCFMFVAMACSDSNDKTKTDKLENSLSFQKENLWSVRMANSDMKRNPEAWMIDFRKKLKWGYTHGLVCKSILEVYNTYGGQKYYDYVEAFADTMVNADGSINGGYELEKFNIDYINSGKILFPIYKTEKDEKYLKALLLLRTQLDDHPRTTQGGFWHKKVYTHQMWLDGLYMGTPFYAEYNQFTNDTAAFDDVVKQFTLIKEHLYDSATGLYLHGWDESREQRWCDSITGKSPHIWGRAVGWFAMAMVDVLDFLPETHAKRPELIAMLKELSTALVAHQEDSTGVWYQVLDLPNREGNYRESTCSSMFTYVMLKGIRKGYLHQDMLPAATKAYNGLLTQFIRQDKDSSYSITNCCAVAGLGGNKNYRDGSFDYYISEPVRANDPKAVGPFILASLEFEKLGIEAVR